MTTMPLFLLHKQLEEQLDDSSQIDDLLLQPLEDRLCEMLDLPLSWHIYETTNPITFYNLAWSAFDLDLTGSLAGTTTND